jgi:hypothetical protein
MGHFIETKTNETHSYYRFLLRWTCFTFIMNTNAAIRNNPRIRKLKSKLVFERIMLIRFEVSDFLMQI